MHWFRFAYRKDEYLIGRVNATAGRLSYAEMIQDLNDLSVLGKNNPAPLQAISFDIAILDAAAVLGSESAKILAMANADADTSDAKKTRDKAFLYLKKAVDEICECGQFAFWKNDARKKGYSSSALRRIRRKNTAPENPKKTTENN